MHVAHCSLHGLLSITFLLSPALCNAEFYKLVDEQGRATYTDHLPDGAKPKSVFGPTQKKILEFRKELKRGDVSSFGLVIEVKKPLAKVQTQYNERWYRIDQLEPAK